MKGKPELVRAARVSAAAQSIGGAYVVMTRNQQLPQEENASAHIAEYSLAEYACKECATVFNANAGINAHCVTCGSSHVEQATSKGETAGKASPSIHADADLRHYTCAGCGSLNITHKDIATAACSMHCVACGHSNAIVADLDMDMAPEDTGDGDSLDDMDMVDTGDESLAEGDGMDEEVILDAPAADGELAPVVDEGDAEEMPPAMTPAVDAPVVDAPVETSPVGVEYSEGDDTVDVDLLALEEDTPVEELSMVWLRDTCAIANATQILATLSAADAGKHADIMQTQEFARAVGKTLVTSGLKETCKTFGFKPVIASLPIKKIVDKHVAAAMAEKAAELEAKIVSVHADFAQATEIATAGVVKNFWKGATDPLKAAMIAELSALGVRNPIKVVDRVWATHAPASMQVILDKAKELSKVSVTARNELAEALDMTNYKPTKVTAADAEDEDADDSAEDDEDEDDAVEARLANAASAVPNGRETASALSRVTSGRATIKQILGGHVGHFNA